MKGDIGKTATAPILILANVTALKKNKLQNYCKQAKYTY
jgi:hypothetical protein